MHNAIDKYNTYKTPCLLHVFISYHVVVLALEIFSVIPEQNSKVSLMQNPNFSKQTTL